MSSELLCLPVDELAALIRRRELTARELVELSLRRIDELDDRIGAFVEVDHERALATVGAVASDDPRPFAGIPISIKNNRGVDGLRLTFGSEMAAAHVARRDHGVVTRLKAAGFIPVGTTALPEFGILPVTEPRLFGPTRNPWDLTRTPGGSSGGSAAAVAAGMVPIAHGNDGGGSLRIPAACCGLVGLKAQRGRVSAAPDLGDSPLVSDGVLTRTVRESALVLDVLAGYVAGDATWAPPPPEPFAVAAAREPERLRIAWTTLPPFVADVCPQAVDAVERTAETLERLGHKVEQVDPPWQVPGLQETFGQVFAIAIATSIAAAAGRLGRTPAPEDVEAMSWATYRVGRDLDAVDAALAWARLQSISRRLIAWLEDGRDAILTPALAERPLKLGTLDTAAQPPLATFERSGRFTPFTSICNASGLPAIALPWEVAADGLPVAVQLIGRPAREGPLLALARQLERARPAWPEREPRISS